MDNKTHMMFHDQDIREETREQTQKEIRSEDIKIFKKLTIWLNEGISRKDISQKLKENFNLDDQEIKDYLS